MEQKKRWYQSKIVLFALTAAVTIGGNLLTGFITGNGVTPDQIQSIESVQPAIANTIENYQNGMNIFQAVTPLIFSAIAVFRVWFTSAKIA